MQAEMERRQSELMDAQDTIKRLEDQLRETQEAKDELEKQQRELQDMMTRLEESKHLEATERARLEEEIMTKRQEVTEIYETVSAKEEENRALQREMEEARVKQEEASKALIEASTTPKHHHLQETEYEDNEEMVNGDTSRDLEGWENEDILDPVNDRRTLAQKNERLQTQLRTLKEDLAVTRDNQAETTMDKIHKENVKQGRDKYKTLREVRKGNTKRRVDQFENM
jgi:radixin